jgi:hypothetical protein
MVYPSGRRICHFLAAASQPVLSPMMRAAPVTSPEAPVSAMLSSRSPAGYPARSAQTC